MEDLLKQAKITNRLLAAQMMLDMSQTELVHLLSNCGLTARDIADVLATSPQTVAVTQVRLRAKQGKQKAAHKRNRNVPEV